VTLIENDLVIGVGVNGGHHGIHDAKPVIDHLGGGRQAVGGAGGIGNHVMDCRIVLVVVHTQHDGQVFVLGRGGNDDLAGAALFNMNIGAGFSLGRIALGVGENAGGFNHNIHPQVLPGQVGGIFFRKDTDRVPVYHEVAANNFHRSRVNPKRGIILEQVGILFGIKQVVDCNHFQLIRIAFQQGFKDQPTNPTKTINTNFYCHFKPPFDWVKDCHASAWLFLSVFFAAGGERSRPLIE